MGFMSWTHAVPRSAIKPDRLGPGFGALGSSNVTDDTKTFGREYEVKWSEI